MIAFRAMTWNVENLFGPGPGEPPVDRQRFERKLGLLAAVIGRLDPDVVALQEVGGEEPLHGLQHALGGTYPHRATSAFPDGRGIRVAFLSKHVVDERTDMVDFPRALRSTSAVWRRRRTRRPSTARAAGLCAPASEKTGWRWT